MRITKVEVIPFSIPLKKSFRYGAATRTMQEHVLFRVHSDTGAVGIGEATPRPAIHGETQVSCVHIVERFLAPRLMGRDPMDRDGYWAEFDAIAWNPTAKGGLDTALHDLVANALGVPLAALLGGSAQPVAISYMAGFGSSAELVTEALDISARTGIEAFKVKAGADPDADVERVRALREALGPAAFIFIDANELYTPEIAVRTLNRLSEYGIAMAEEPVPVDLGRLRKKVADAVPVPLLADDSVETLADARRELEDGAIGVLGIKPPRSGLHNAVKILHLGEAYGVPCWIGSQGVTGIGTLASAHFAAAHTRSIPYPADLGNFLRQEDDLLENPIDLREGRIHLPPGPGSGVRIDERKLAKYRVDK